MKDARLPRQRGTETWPTGMSTGRCPAAGRLRLLVLMVGKSGGDDSSSALVSLAHSMSKTATFLR